MQLHHTESPERALSPIWLGAGLVLGLVAASGGALALASVSAPGTTPAQTRVWPADTRLSPAHDAPTLVMMVRPLRSCADPDLSVLAAALARAATTTKSYVVIRRPKGLTDRWEENESWRQALAMPGVTVVRDDDGVEAQRFGLTASGEMHLYDADRTLIFSDRLIGAPRDVAARAGRATVVSLSASACLQTAPGL